ncbi:hypothetical protein RND81_04G049000 [Saponaria officinalis]
MKRLDESLNQLNKYSEVFNSKKQQTKERFGGSNLPKVGIQSHQSSPELAAQKLEDRNKNFVLNKRARTPVGDLRAEVRRSGALRQQQMLRKDKDSATEGSSDIVETNICILTAGGEGWDIKRKRKRSMSSVCPRPLDSDGELKKTMHRRPGNDSSIYTSDGHGFRSGSSNGVNGSNKMDGSPSSGNLSGRVALKIEPEKNSSSKELTGMNKERLLQKGNTKLNMRGDPQLLSPSFVTKVKASRAHRSGPGTVGNTSPNFSKMLGTLEDSEQPLNVKKVHSLARLSNRKRPLPPDTSSPPMVQWKGQRPQKISRNRRTNIVSPTSNPDVVQSNAEGHTTSDFSIRMSAGMNGSLPVRNIMISSQQLKTKLESVQSPTKLSENEENIAVEIRLTNNVLGGADNNEKGIHVHQQGSPGLLKKKSKLLVNDEIGDGVRRQGRSGRGPSFPKVSISPMTEKPESPPVAKPFRSTRPGSEKNGSKLGRPPLKKQCDRKGSIRPGPILNSSCPDFAGESDDDRDEILAVAQFVCNASYDGCSSSFWKRWEPLFNVREEDKTFLEEQLKAIENHHPSPSQGPVIDDNVTIRVSQTEKCRPRSFVPDKSKICVLDNGATDSTKTKYIISEFQDHNYLFNGLVFEKGPNKLTPLFQRVLSALIVEAEFEEYKDNNFFSNIPSLAISEDPCTLQRSSCNGNASHKRNLSAQVRMHDEIEEVDYSLSYPTGQMCSLLDCDYDQMRFDDKLLLELQSIGIYPDTVPDLAEELDELMDDDIAQLKKQLSEQAAKKKTYLEIIHEAIEKDGEERDLETVALDRLTEVAYRKLLATRGNYAVKSGISKVPKHVALAFVTRTLARCQKYEETGRSCFSEYALRDALLAVPRNNSGSATTIQAEQKSENRLSDGGIVGSTFEQPVLQYDKSASSQSDDAFAKNGPILNRGKKKMEVLLDDFGGNAPTLGSTLVGGGAKGKRSERDSNAKAKGERKTKSKPRQKAAQLFVQPATNISSSNSRRQEGSKSPSNNIPDSSKEANDPINLISSLPLSELDSIDGLNVANEFEGHQDLSSWLNFDEVEGLQDDDGIGGLQIPMDDLSELNMLL